MQVVYLVRDLSENAHSVRFDEPSICPICHHAIKPQVLASRLYEGAGKTYASFLCLCKACYASFLVQVPVVKAPREFFQIGDIIMGPKSFIPVTFSSSISVLSPNFVEIYNQANAAENSDLKHVAGIGYRKSIEFLVKDFIITVSPSKEDVVKKTQLGPCIQEYIENEKIKVLAKASSWIGNDETHYVRKHEDYDINDLKKFISALVSFIDYELTVNEAMELITS